VAIATYLKSLPAERGPGRGARPRLGASQRNRPPAQLYQRGRPGLRSSAPTATGHGGGVKGVFPALAGNPTVATRTRPR
jgi:thiosulfate dehydrogenase